jgi:hypothetical protein
VKLDSSGFIVLEQEGFPGNIGDSCAETSRYVTLKTVFGQAPKINLRGFMTPQGLIRYPTGPWGPSDTSDDQLCPFIGASAIVDPDLCTVTIRDTQDNWGRAGNNQFIHPTSFGQIARAKKSWAIHLLDFFILCQALIFLIPIRWDDGQKKFVSSSDSYSDYLNFANYIAFAYTQKSLTWWCRLAMKIIPQERVMENVVNYYKPEPNVQWLLDVYTVALGIIYKDV